MVQMGAYYSYVSILYKRPSLRPPVNTGPSGKYLNLA